MPRSSSNPAAATGKSAAQTELLSHINERSGLGAALRRLHQHQTESLLRKKSPVKHVREAHSPRRSPQSAVAFGRCVPLPGQGSVARSKSPRSSSTGRRSSPSVGLKGRTSSVSTTQSYHVGAGADTATPLSTALTAAGEKLLAHPEQGATGGLLGNFDVLVGYRLVDPMVGAHQHPRVRSTRKSALRYDPIDQSLIYRHSATQQRIGSEQAGAGGVSGEPEDADRLSESGSSSGDEDERDNDKECTRYAANVVFPSSYDSHQIGNHLIPSLLYRAMNGAPSIVAAHGAAKSGKTSTLFGTGGLFPSYVMQLLYELDRLHLAQLWAVQCSFVEVVGDAIYDALAAGEQEGAAQDPIPLPSSTHHHQNHSHQPHKPWPWCCAQSVVIRDLESLEVLAQHLPAPSSGEDNGSGRRGMPTTMGGVGQARHFLASVRVEPALHREGIATHLMRPMGKVHFLECCDRIHTARSTKGSTLIKKGPVALLNVLSGLLREQHRQSGALAGNSSMSSTTATAESVASLLRGGSGGALCTALAPDLEHNKALVWFLMHLSEASAPSDACRSTIDVAQRLLKEKYPTGIPAVDYRAVARREYRKHEQLRAEQQTSLAQHEQEMSALKHELFMLQQAYEAAASRADCSSGAGLRPRSVSPPKPTPQPPPKSGTEDIDASTSSAAGVAQAMLGDMLYREQQRVETLEKELTEKDKLLQDVQAERDELKLRILAMPRVHPHGGPPSDKTGSSSPPRRSHRGESSAPTDTSTSIVEGFRCTAEDSAAATSALDHLQKLLKQLQRHAIIDVSEEWNSAASPLRRGRSGSTSLTGAGRARSPTLGTQGSLSPTRMGERGESANSLVLSSHDFVKLTNALLQLTHQLCEREKAYATLSSLLQKKGISISMGSRDMGSNITPVCHWQTWRRCMREIHEAVGEDLCRANGQRPPHRTALQAPGFTSLFHLAASKEIPTDNNSAAVDFAQYWACEISFPSSPHQLMVSKGQQQGPNEPTDQTSSNTHPFRQQRSERSPRASRSPPSPSLSPSGSSPAGVRQAFQESSAMRMRMRGDGGGGGGSTIAPASTGGMVHGPPHRSSPADPLGQPTGPSSGIGIGTGRASKPLSEKPPLGASASSAGGIRRRAEAAELLSPSALQQEGDPFSPPSRFAHLLAATP